MSIKATRPVWVAVSICWALAGMAQAESLVGACCFALGAPCQELSPEDCAAAGGYYQGDDTLCVDGCPTSGACCLPDGSCLIAADVSDCFANYGGTSFAQYRECPEVICEVYGACCLPDGSCGSVLEESFCTDDLGGIYQGDGTACVFTDCPQPMGACCINTGDGPGDLCELLTPTECGAAGGWYAGDGTACGTVNCALTGACCLAQEGAGLDVLCEELTPGVCADFGGWFSGIGTTCAEPHCVLGACCLVKSDSTFCEPTLGAVCEMYGGWFAGPGTDCDDVDCDEVGACCFEASLGGCQDLPAAWCLAYGGTFLGQDTVCGPNSCDMATPVGACCFVSCQVPNGSTCAELTEDDCLSQGGSYLGDGTMCGFVECTVPCDLPGRPANDGSNDRVLRGFIVGWAVNADNAEIRHNHLAGNATTIDYRAGSASQTNAWSFPVVDSAAGHGQPLGTPGELFLDGTEYVPAYSSLLMNFTAEGSAAFSGPSDLLVSRSQLTLHPVSVDFRDGGVPVTTKASFEVWNENEVKFSGMHRCVTCWDETVLGDYGVPNHFNLPSLQTDFGAARIDGLASALCPDSTDAALLGQIAQTLREDFEMLMPPNPGLLSSARNLVGMGTQGAVIRYDLEAPPEESPADAALRGMFGDASTTAVRSAVALRASGARAPAPETLSPPVDVPDRVSGTEKGSLVYFSNVELRWDCHGNLVRDTFIQLTNDFPDAVRVQFYFVNGDAPLHDDVCDESHPGWNFVDNAITLTGNQTIWWSVLTGQPYGLSPFTVLDP